MHETSTGETVSAAAESREAALETGRSRSWRDRAIAFAFFAVLAAASYAPIWSSDYFWHLSAGRWIVENRALPASDPLTVASSREPWIDGEWLFQLALFGVHRVGGDAAVALLRAAAIAALFTFLFVRLLAAGSRTLALSVAFFSWYGALPWLRERPSAPGAAFALLLIVILGLRSLRVRAVLVFLLGVLWMNVHPSALLAPAIVGIDRVSSMLEERSFSRSRILELLLLTGLATVALLVNPWGLAGALNPLHVATIAQLPVFANEEWGPSRLGEFRFFAVALVAAAAVLLTSARRPGWLSSAALLVAIGALAIRLARSQTIFFVTAPLLLIPHLRLPREGMVKLLAIPLAITAIAIVMASPFAGGIDTEKFPVEATARVQAAQLHGNVLSSYGLGGFLTWSFDRERRVLNDGRNELHLDYQQRWQEARQSSASLARFFDDYAVGLAWVGMDEGPVWIRDAATEEWRPLRRWDVYFPRDQWALVAIDRAAAVFARRSMNDPRAIERVELPRELLPPAAKAGGR
ncbi:MAG: hypothetical protein WC538_13450 [Thermoanaerobaculia bacterium]|jgi:hypothetical protein